jgi:FtsH-binding integral membrane protein
MITNTSTPWAAIALFGGLLAVFLFVWVDMFRYSYPLQITLLTIPYGFSSLALVFALYFALQGGFWTHALLIAAGLFVTCALV